MAKDEKEEQEEQEELTEEQRITRLEKQASTNKILLLIIALLMIIVTTITITAFTLILAKGSDKPTQTTNTAPQELSDLRQQVEDQKSQLSTFSINLSEIEGKVNNSSNAVIQSALLGLEKDNQKFLSALRSGVYDLAHMVPGSRTWLELYSEQIDETIEQSKAREALLKKLQTSEPVSEEDPFFGDDF